MTFSEKSSFAQSGISITCVVEDVKPNNYFNSIELLRNATVSLVIASVVDACEHDFLVKMIST
jgi:hypothetical protein